MAKDVHPNIDVEPDLPADVVGLDLVSDSAVLAYFEHCVHVCANEFRVRAEALPQPFRVLEGGTVAEYRMDAKGDTPSIILKAGSDEWQVRTDAGHEVFHWLRTPPDAFPGIFHWTHEMLANEISLRCLRAYEATWRAEHAVDDYRPEQHAVAYEEWLAERASEASLEKMLTTRLRGGVPYSWVFGRAFVTGRRLQEAVGWEWLKRLAVKEPDVLAWLAALPSKPRRAAESVLGEPSGSWV